MIDIQTKEIRDALRLLGDINRQKQLWLNIDNENNCISSFDEEIQYLYSNLRFKEFIVNNRLSLNNSLYNELKVFAEELYDYWHSIVEKDDDEKIHKYVINDSYWQELSEKVKLILDQLSR